MTFDDLTAEDIPGLSKAVEIMTLALEAGGDEFVEPRQEKLQKAKLEGGRAMRDHVKHVLQELRDRPAEEDPDA